MRNNKYSNFKIFHFPEKLNSFKERRVTAPIYVRIKPINLCNHGCFFCTYSTGFRVKDGAEEPHINSLMHQDMKEKDKIPEEKLIEILEDLQLLGVKSITWSGGGEPLMHRGIVRAIDFAADIGLDQSIITNGHLLFGDRAVALNQAKWVRVSMDYTNGKQLKRFRNVPEDGFNEILWNISEFARKKPRECDLGVNFIIHKGNWHNLEQFSRELKNSGVENIRFSPMYVPNFREYHAPFYRQVQEQLAKIQDLCDSTFSVNSTYSIEEDGNHGPHRAYKRCLIMQTIPVIGADLNVYACHNKAYDQSGLIGSIKDRRFAELWYHPDTWEKMMTFDPQASCQHECANDKKNILINDFLNASTDNFV